MISDEDDVAGVPTERIHFLARHWQLWRGAKFVRPVLGVGKKFACRTHVLPLRVGAHSIKRAKLESQGQRLHVRAIANSRRLLVADDELSLEDWEGQLERDGRPYEPADIIAIKDHLGLLNPTIVDCSTNEDLAGRYVDYLAHGFNVACANKKANTMDMAYYLDLRETAEKNFRKFLYETNVGAGLPVIDTLMGLMRSGEA